MSFPGRKSLLLAEDMILEIALVSHIFLGFKSTGLGLKKIQIPVPAEKVTNCDRGKNGTLP